MKQTQSQNIFNSQRPYTAVQTPKIDDMIQSIAAQARQNKAEIDQKLKNDPGSRLGISLSQSNFDRAGPIPARATFRTPTHSENPSMMRVAGKTSTNISIEKNKKQLFENLEDINKSISDEVSNRDKKPQQPQVLQRARPMTSVPQTSVRIQTKESPQMRLIDRRRSNTSHGSRSSHNSNQEQAARVAQSIILDSISHGPAFAYEDHSGFRTKQDRYGAQYGDFFNHENKLYSTFSNSRAFKVNKKKPAVGTATYW